MRNTRAKLHSKIMGPGRVRIPPDSGSASGPVFRVSGFGGKGGTSTPPACKPPPGCRYMEPHIPERCWSGVRAAHLWRYGPTIKKIFGPYAPRTNGVKRSPWPSSNRRVRGKAEGRNPPRRGNCARRRQANPFFPFPPCNPQIIRFTRLFGPTSDGRCLGRGRSVRREFR